MPKYIDLELDPLDAETLRQNGRDYMASQAPGGWAINPWLDWLLSAVARMAVVVLVLASRVPWAIFKAFGEKILGVSKVNATAATGSVTFHLASNPAGRTIDPGALVDIDGISFETSTPLTLGTGVLTGSVPVIAQQTGAAGSGLTGTTVDLILPTLVWVNSVTLDAVTIGGTDGETDDEYVDRLPDEIPLLSPKAILSADAAAIARRDPEVFRALAIDNFVPPSTTGVAGAITDVVMAADGGDVSSPGRTRVETALEAGRILAISASVINPTRNAVKVTFAAQCYPDQNPPTVLASAKQAIKDFLAPVRWGVPPGGDPEDWIDETLLRRDDLVVVLGGVPGIRHVTSMTLALTSGTLGTANVTLAGPGAVPTIADVDLNGTVTT